MASTTALISLKAAFVARPSTFTSYGISLRRDGFDQRLDRIDSFLDLTDLSTDLFIDHMDLFHRHHDSFLDLTELVVDIDLEVITNLLHCDLEGFETRLGDLAITAAIPANCVRAASLSDVRPAIGRARGGARVSTTARLLVSGCPEEKVPPVRFKPRVWWSRAVSVVGGYAVSCTLRASPVSQKRVGSSLAISREEK